MAPTRRAKPRGQPQSGQTEHQSLLALKKEAWHLRICERRSAAGAVEDLEYAIDEATVEAFSKEVEALRLSLGLHWTWFQEELASGSYDGHLEGEDVLPPPLEAYHEDTISLAKLCKTRRSPPLSTRSSSASTHAPSPGSAPRSPPMQGAQKICIPQEVWLAAERHRKSNFFAAALWQSSVPQLQLSWILTFVEVCEVLDLALSSTAFAGALLGRGCEEELWRCLGARATGGEAVERLPFAGDPSFRACTWLRRQRFFQRVGRGQGVASVVGPVSQLGGPGTRLGPFLPSADSQCGRLVVSDHQTSRVLDVERRRREQVEIDRYNSRRLLLSSLELHPVEVTTSWPLEDAAHCCAGGGMVAAKPLKGVACGTALQWLELPDFEQNGETEACRALARTSLRQEQLAAALEVTSSSLVIESTWPLPQNQVLLLVRDLPATNAGEKKHREVMPDALGATGAERLEASGRWWLQVWSLDAHRKEFQPRAKAQLKWKVTCVDCADLKGELLLLCGGERHAELFDLRTLSSIGRWEVSHAVKHVLLREAHEANEAIAILGQETAVLVATKESVHAVLPHKAFDALAVEALQPVGTRGFAVCSRRHVYGFEVNGDGAQLMATVELPNGDGKVEHFFASPYEFFVVIRREKRAKPRAISCLWPHRGEAKATGAYAVSLKAWAGEQLSETSAVAVDLKFLLTGGPIETLSYHCAPLGTRGQDLLAVSAVGGGVAVVRWGMEVNPAVDFIREMREAKLAQQEEEHQREVWRRQLQRLQQRLQETEKLEEKASRQEALTSEETAKVGRRPQVEAEIERLIHELGLDHHSEEEESEADPEEERSAALAERRRAKERVQRQHHEEKRAMQKERQRNRDRKFS